MSSKFQEFPKILKHPNHADAVFIQPPCKCKRTPCNCRTGLFAVDTVCTSPERYPDVTVSDQNQEEHYVSRGYRSSNIANASEFEKSLLDSSVISGSVSNEYPKWKYHPVEIPLLVNDLQEEKSLGNEWSNVPVMATEDDLEYESSSFEEEKREVKIDKRSKAYKESIKLE